MIKTIILPDVFYGCLNWPLTPRTGQVVGDQ